MRDLKLQNQQYKEAKPEHSDILSEGLFGAILAK
ncbi:hypothetical protein MED92_04412 [Neptuniibacter caesariensis]|uniref:Uncharacterized protein n=1 Tax=Neptuniibacter caesariensis TaxID=207954 RepID=A0A7U8GSW5_NEPCE|nr:hypothetical protein MED92_04412 [Neptuniibacter caesariensis]